MLATILCLSALLTAGASEAPDTIRFQGHRGGLKEAPENTMAAFHHTWSLGGLPEVDIRTTKDGVILCLHDKTLERTTNAKGMDKTPISQLTFEQVRQWDAGVRFDPRFTGERVPSLDEVFLAMSGKPKRKIYIDLKEVDLGQLKEHIDQRKVAKQIIFSHNKIESCRRIGKAVPELRTMLWIGGKPAEMKAKFRIAARESFQGLDQVQLHLHRLEESADEIHYDLDPAFLQWALDETHKHHIDLEVLPFQFDCRSLSELLDLGICWYATDEPKRLRECTKQHTP